MSKWTILFVSVFYDDRINLRIFYALLHELPHSRIYNNVEIIDMWIYRSIFSFEEHTYAMDRFQSHHDVMA